MQNKKLSTGGYVAHCDKCDRSWLSDKPLHYCATCDVITHEQVATVIRNMEIYGGGFAKALSVALARADAENTLKIRETWSDLWDKYLNWGK